MQSVQKTSKSQDDYLEAILNTIKENGFCRSIDLSRRMGYATSSISIAVGRLEKAGFVRRGRAGQLLLTEEGNAIASSVLEKHLFFSEWLQNLGVSESIAEQDACRLEHAISDKSFHILKTYIDANP